MSNDPKAMHDKLLSMAAGIFLLMFSIAAVAFDTSNFQSFGHAFFGLINGIMLVMVGALNGMDKKPKQ